MRKITAIVILCLLPSLSNSAQETKEISKNSNSSSTEDYTKFRFGGYGEMVANFKDYASTVSMEETMVIQRKTGIPFQSPVSF